MAFRGRRKGHLVFWWSNVAFPGSDFVAGAVNHDLWTRIGGSLGRKLRLGILSLEVLLLQNALAGLRDVSLNVRIVTAWFLSTRPLVSAQVARLFLDAPGHVLYGVSRPDPV